LVGIDERIVHVEITVHTYKKTEGPGHMEGLQPMDERTINFNLSFLHFSPQTGLRAFSSCSSALRLPVLTLRLHTRGSRGGLLIQGDKFLLGMLNGSYYRAHRWEWLGWGTSREVGILHTGEPSVIIDEDQK
jgi:hypothetical protein